MAISINKVIGSVNADNVELLEAEYKGLSTDVKPTDCMVNSLFLELDTGKVYYFDGSDWNEVGA